MGNHDYSIKHSISEQRLFQGGGPILGHLDIELTERCNNACIHCYINLPADDAQAVRREFTTDQWKDTLRQAADLGALSVRFTGGEPLLRADFGEIYLFARRLGMKVMLFTNARLITPELADLFARVPPLKKIEISVYGMEQESYEAVSCVKGSFDEFRRGVDLLVERHVPFFVKPVFLAPNRKEMEKFETWAATILNQDMKPSYAVSLDFRTRRDSPTRNRLIDGLRVSPEQSVAMLNRSAAAYRKEMAGFCSQFIGPPGERIFNCGAGKAGCVDPYGSYQMCMMLRHPDTVYDLTKSTMRQALTELFPRLRGTVAANQAYRKRCARCFLKGLCEQCPAKSWAEYGTLDTPVEYSCQVAHAQAHYLGLLEEGESAWDVEDWQQRIEIFMEKVRAASEDISADSI